MEGDSKIRQLKTSEDSWRRRHCKLACDVWW